MPEPIKDDFMGYDKFSHIPNKRLQAYNRIITFYKITKDEKSIATAQRYIQEFNDSDKNDIKSLFKDLQIRGLSKVRRELSEDKIYV